MNSENIITIIGIAAYGSILLALCILLARKANETERQHRNSRERARQHQENELRGQGRLLVSSNSVTKGER